MDKGLRIFISYSTKDDEVLSGWITQFVDIFKKELNAVNRRKEAPEVFFAPESIQAGDEWRKKYLSYIGYNLSCMISFLSVNYLKSQYCVEEINKALSLKENGWKGIIIPVYINGGCVLGKLADNLGDSGLVDLVRKITDINFLDWRPLRFTSIDDKGTRQEIFNLSSRIDNLTDSGAAEAAWENAVIIDDIKDGKVTIKSADNDDVFNRQENKYDDTFQKVIKLCTQRVDRSKQLIVLELDYRKPERALKHLAVYEQLDIPFGQMFILCSNEEQQRAIENIGNKEITAFILEGKVDSAALIECFNANGFPKPDVIYSDRNYRKFEDPEYEFLQIRRHLLSENGSFAVKGFDDGSKICYPDPEGLMDKIINMTSRKKNVSDRFNGRKLYSRFKLAGFKEFFCEYVMNDTVRMNLDERVDLYEESFDFRKNYFDDDSPEKAEMTNYLKKMRNMFCDENFEASSVCVRNI